MQEIVDQLIEKLKAYFGLFTGEKRVPEDLQARMDAVLDKTAIIVTPSGELDMDTYASSLPHHFMAGLKIEILHMDRAYEGEELVGLEYKLHLVSSEFDHTVHTIAFVENGKIVRVKPLENKEAYDEMFQKAREDLSVQQAAH
jgi:hypothetical protein